jgi:hypothetical protein
MSKIELGKPVAEKFYAKRAFRIIIAEAIIANSFPFIIRDKRSSEVTTVDQVIEEFCISNRSCMRQLLNGEINSDFLVSHALLCERYTKIHSGIVYAILMMSMKYDIPEIQLIKKIL